MNRNIVAIVTVVCLLSVSGTAQFVKNVSKVGTTSAVFLEIEAGARAIGMGGAFVGVANDASALYWNPAGISRLNMNEAVFNHTEWLAGIDYNFVGVVVKMDDANSLGAYFSGVNMADMEVTTIEYPEGTGEVFSVTSSAIGLSFARNLTDRFSIGFSGKYIREDIWHMSAATIAMDIGTLFRTNLNGMTIGMSISNFGSKMQLKGKDTSIQHDIDENKEGNNDRIYGHLDTGEWPLPLLFRVGVAMDVINSSFNKLTVAADAMHPSDNLESMNVGMEYSVANFVFVRAGYTNLFLKDGEETYSLGAGLQYRIRGMFGLKADYSYSNFGILNNPHRFSLALQF